VTEFDADAAEERRSTGVLGQLNRVRRSAVGLVRAHIALLRAEISDIVNQLKSIAALAGVALVVALLTANLLYVGGFLFLGEWLFGSIGWGLAHGVLLGVAIIVTVILSIVGAPRNRSFIGLLLAVAAVIGIALFAGLNIGSDSAAYLAGQLAPPFDSPGLVALLGGAVIGGAVLMLILAFVGGLSGALAGLVLGAVLGAILGWLLAGAAWTWPPAVGFAIVIGLILWPVLAVLLAWRDIDLEERFSRLYPRQSIEAANETKAWLEEQWQTRRPKVGQ
jgi:hypothetical protein